jgi:hypothetical protein
MKPDETTPTIPSEKMIADKVGLNQVENQLCIPNSAYFRRGIELWDFW